jgi:hypothetical protein
MKVTREVGMFLMSVFEQSGVTVTPELSKLIDLSFGNADQKLLMQAAVEAMKTSRGRITIAEVQKQLDLLSPRHPDEHPSAEEAWSLVPKSEYESAMLTGEMTDAYFRGGIRDYLERDDHWNAEKTFKKLYDENVSKSRAAGKKAVWAATMGADKSMRVIGLEKAVSMGRMTSDMATNLDPQNQAIYLATERSYLENLPDNQRKALEGRIQNINKNLLMLAEAKDNQEKDRPDPEKMKNPDLATKANQLGLTIYEYLMPMKYLTDEKRKSIFENLNKQFCIKLEPESFGIARK